MFSVPRCRRKLDDKAGMKAHAVDLNDDTILTEVADYNDFIAEPSQIVRYKCVNDTWFKEDPAKGLTLSKLIFV